MINILKEKTKETIILKPNISIEQIKKDISLQLYYYLIKKEGFGTGNITRALRNTLKFDQATIQKTFDSLCGEYLTYLENNDRLTNRDDIYLRNMLLNSKGMVNQVANTILSNSRMIQRMCEVNMENIMAEIMSKQNLGSSYMQKTAKTTPVNTNVPNTLAAAQEMYHGIKEYSGYNYADQEFNYDEVTFGEEHGNPVENDFMYGVNAKRKNAIYKVGNMTGILNIGQKGNSQYKDRQEDSILLYEHPEDKKFKVAVVADGMGGGGKGDKASYIATKMTMEWFKALPKEFFNNNVLSYSDKYGRRQTISFNQVLAEHLANVNDEIVRQLGNEPGTTFSAAIMRQENGKDIVNSVSIGDSKILKIGNDGRVSQLVKDDNVLYDGIKNNSLYILGNDRNTIYSNNPRFTYPGDKQINQIPYRPLSSTTKDAYFLQEEDMRFYRANNVIRECLGAGRTGDSLLKKIASDPNSFLAKHEFKPGEKIFLCSDGIGDNLTRQDIRDVFFTKTNARECLKNVINKIYEIQKQRQTLGNNNPNQNIKGHNEFNQSLKGARDNISGVIIENKGEER